MKLPLESSTLLLVLKFLIIRINLFLNAKLYFKNNSYKEKKNSYITNWHQILTIKFVFLHFLSHGAYTMFHLKLCYTIL